MLTRLIVHFAYFLDTSTAYQNCKRFFYTLLIDQDSRSRFYFDAFMVSLVLLSVFLQIYQENNKLDLLAVNVEYGVIIIFVVEYLLRIWVNNNCHKIILEHYEKAVYLRKCFNTSRVLIPIVINKLAYLISPFALIDLLAIISCIDTVRDLKVFVIFRLFKLIRYISGFKLFAHLLASKRIELYSLGIFLGFLLFTGSVGIYLFEHHARNSNVHDMFDAIYFSTVTVATVGFGDISPKTTGGRMVTMIMIFSGLAFISFFTSIIVSAFSERMLELHEHRAYSDIKHFKNFVIICGFGRVGQHISWQLANNKQQFVIIDTDETKIQKARQSGFLAIHADASKNSVLKNAGINNKAKAILCTTGDDVVNVYITLSSRHLNNDIRIISRANNSENVKKLYQAGANNVIQPFEIAGMIVAGYIGQPVAFEAILGILREEKEFTLETLCVFSGSFIEGKKISEIDFAQRKLSLIGVISSNSLHRKHKNSYQIKHQHFYFNPAKFFELQSGDLLVLLGRSLSIDYFREQIEQSCDKKGTL